MNLSWTFREASNYTVPYILVPKQMGVPYGRWKQAGTACAEKIDLLEKQLNSQM